MTIKELSELLGVSKSSIARAIRELDIEPAKKMNRFILSADDMERIADYIGVGAVEAIKAHQSSQSHQSLQQNAQNASEIAPIASIAPENEPNASEELFALYRELIDSKDKTIDNLQDNIKDLHNIIDNLTRTNAALSMRVAFLEEQREPVKDIEPEQAAADGTDTEGERPSLRERIKRLFRKMP